MTVRVDNSVPVFEGQQKVSTDALVPGSDVRVFYRTPTDGTQPQAVAIENGAHKAAIGEGGESRDLALRIGGGRFGQQRRMHEHVGGVGPARKIAPVVGKGGKARTGDVVDSDVSRTWPVVAL